MEDELRSVDKWATITVSASSRSLYALRVLRGLPPRSSRWSYNGRQTFV